MEKVFLSVAPMPSSSGERLYKLKQKHRSKGGVFVSIELLFRQFKLESNLHLIP